ncbi:glycosyl transferase [Campylobacter jejuni]
MNEKNVVLLGGSNSVMVNGLQKGIRESIYKYNNKNFIFYNFALGVTTSIQNLYELKRNKAILKNTELIITESNINEIVANNNHEKLPLKIIFRNLFWFYQELYFLNKKILILLLPYQIGNYKIINQIHKKLCQKFNFNLIDMQNYYEKNNLEEFGNRVDNGHQQASIMRILGNNILKNINNYPPPKKHDLKNDNPQFVICTPKSMKIASGNLKEKQIKNSIYNEITYRIDKDTKLIFSNLYNNYNIIAIHTWNNYDNINLNFIDAVSNYSNIKISNKKISLSKECNFLNAVMEIHHIFNIDNKSIINYNYKNDANIQEYYEGAHSWRSSSIKADHCDIIGFLLASPEGNYHTEEIDFEALANENIIIPKEYDFNHLIPPIELYKEIIDEYCTVMDPRKLASLQKQISILTQEKQDLQNKFQNELNSLPVKKQRLELANLEQDLIIKKLESKKLAKSLGIKMSIINPKITFIQANSAKARIQNHLPYKLGQALITNSKNILGYIRMPFVLSYVKDKHKFEQKAYEEKIKENPNLALPPLETYPDYNEALKEKECFTYKLGEAFIKASKNWYGGGYIKFIFKDVPRLKRGFRKR